MTATGIGSLPGTDYAEALRVVLGELDLPFVPELPARGVGAAMIGRGLSVVSGLGVDLQPAGWRLTDAAGVDHRRARSLLAQDLDGVEEFTAGYSGPFKTQLVGPWTLAACVEKPRGDKVLSDHGARRDLAQSLAEGITEHVADLRRRLPGVDDLLVQVDEPALPAVLAAQIPTASGFGKHRAVHPPEAAEALEWVLTSVADAGAVPVVHCCASDVPIALLRGAGAAGIAVDLDVLAPAGYDELAEALEAGDRVLLGVVPSVRPAGAVPSEGAVTERVLRLLDMLGLEPTEGLIITPGCGLAGADGQWARQALTLAQRTAQNLG